MNSRTEKLIREIISRLAMMLLGAGLLYASAKCLFLWVALQNSPVPGNGLPILLAIVLGLPGLFFAIASLLSIESMSRLFRPAPPTSGVNDVDSPGTLSALALWVFKHWY